jgi:hypothetical protein
MSGVPTLSSEIADEALFDASAAPSDDNFSGEGGVGGSRIG